MLRIVVTDDGVGGADPRRGTGLRGLADRVSGVDGRLFVDSPAGGTDRAHRGAAVRVVIAEDSVLLREGLARLLGGGRLRGGGRRRRRRAAAPLGRRAPARTSSSPTCGCRRPTRDEGVRAALVIRQRWPETAVLVLSQYVEERYATELLAGDTRGVGYLLKDRVADVEEFTEALRRVGRGGTALDPEVVSQLLARGRRRPAGRADPARAGRAAS